MQLGICTVYVQHVQENIFGYQRHPVSKDWNSALPEGPLKRRLHLAPAHWRGRAQWFKDTPSAEKWRTISQQTAAVDMSGFVLTVFTQLWTNHLPRFGGFQMILV